MCEQLTYNTLSRRCITFFWYFLVHGFSEKFPCLTLPVVLTENHLKLCALLLVHRWKQSFKPGPAAWGSSDLTQRPSSANTSVNMRNIQKLYTRELKYHTLGKRKSSVKVPLDVLVPWRYTPGWKYAEQPWNSLFFGSIYKPYCRPSEAPCYSYITWYNCTTYCSHHHYHHHDNHNN